MTTTIENIYRDARARGLIWDYAHRSVQAAENREAAMRWYLRQAGVYIPKELRA